MVELKPERLMQNYHCPGSCTRELHEGDTCYHGTCEYHRNDPIYKKVDPSTHENKDHE